MTITGGVAVPVLMMTLISLSSAADPCAVQSCRIKFVVFSETPRRFFIQFFSAAWTASDPLFILNMGNAGHYYADDGCYGEWKAHMLNELGDKESEFFFRIEGNSKVNITIREAQPTGKLGPGDIKVEYCGQEPQVISSIKTIGSEGGDIKQDIAKKTQGGGESSLPNKLSSSSGFLKPNGQDLPLAVEEAPVVSIAAMDSRTTNTTVGQSDAEGRLQQQYEALTNLCNSVCVKL